MKTQRAVAMYTPSPRGGHAEYTRELLTALAEGTSWAVELVTSADLEQSFRRVPYPIADVLPARGRDGFRNRMEWAISRALYYVRRDWMLAAWVRGHRPPILHLQETTAWIGVVVVGALRRLDVSLVLTVHNLSPHRAPPRGLRRLRSWTDEGMWRRCHALIVHDRELAEALRARIGAASPLIEIVPHGVWTTTEELCPWRGRPRRLLVFGTLRANKGLHLLVDAMVGLPQHSLTIAGQVVDEEYVANVVVPRVAQANRRRPGCVDLVPTFVADEDRAELFAGHDALVLPYETFTAESGVLYQAVAAGRPVVVTDVGALAATVVRFGIGTVAPTATSSDLSSAILRLDALDPEGFRRGVESLRDQHGWPAVAAHHAMVYERVLPCSRSRVAGS